MRPIDQFAAKEIATLEAASLRRQLRERVRDGVMVREGGREYVSFACNDYLGLSQHPEVITAGKQALEQYGAGAGASRLVTGNHLLYAPLEAKLAKLKGKEAALVFGSGYLTNLGIVPALVGKGDVIYADKLVHACMLDGAQLSGATLKRFRHNDMAHLAELLAERGQYKHALIMTDHVFSMDGDVAPLEKMAALAQQHDAWLMADDAHGLGIIHEYPNGVDLWMGTLSKAAGAYGGYVAASRTVIDYLTSAARSLVYTTGLPPAVCASALTALEVMEREPQRGARALELARRVVPTAQSAIVPIVLGEAEAALSASDKLKEQGLLVVAIRPPTVPPGTARLRLAFSSEHTDAQVEQLRAALESLQIQP